MDRKDPHFVRYRYRVTRALQPFRQLRAIVATLVGQKRAAVMMMQVMSDGRLFGLTLFDWAALLVGMTGCGVLTSLL
jgi:hypothetical protein